MVKFFDGDPRLRRGETQLATLEWTINDVPLSKLVKDGTSIPLLYDGADPGSRSETLHRLRGDRSDRPTFVRRFERSWLNRLFGMKGIPWAFSGPAFEDGRVVLLECPCGDLDCGALTTEIVVGDETIEWRDIGWQVTYEPFAGFNDEVRSARFDRTEYTSLIDDLLTTDWAQIR